ncbi:insulinase family protein, partial [Candidatus Microgenomates bacterium]|nr:insulinase family protein [Candidatus Microgenomates bacterium]
MKYQVKTFKNKIRLVSIPLPVKSVAVEISVDAGSRYETEKNWGISHFVEHMLFKGTKRRPTAHDLASEVDSFGGVFNAGTGKEQTSFYIKSAADKLSKDLDILVDILTNSKFEPGEIEKEKGVILEEINMREDIPMAKVGEIFDGLLYGETPLGRMILGKKENIIKMKREDFLSYMKRFYRPERMVVSVAGDVRLLRGVAKRLLGGVSSASRNSSTSEESRSLPQHLRGVLTAGVTPLSFTQTQPQLKLHYKKTNQAHFCLGVRT